MKYNSWYYNRHLKPQGPVSTHEMRQLILQGDVGPRDLISAQEEGSWLAAEEWGVFERSLFPASQQYIAGVEVAPELKEWVLLVHDDEKRVLQEGPFSLEDLQNGLRQQRIHPDQFVWKAGLSGWSRISDRPEFIASN